MISYESPWLPILGSLCHFTTAAGLNHIAHDDNHSSSGTPYSVRLAACFASGWGCLTKAHGLVFYFFSVPSAIWFNPAAVVKRLGTLTLCTFVSFGTCMRACMYVYMYVCMYVCVRVLCLCVCIDDHLMSSNLCVCR